jgi:hypothetical protein
MRRILSSWASIVSGSGSNGQTWVEDHLRKLYPGDDVMLGNSLQGIVHASASGAFLRPASRANHLVRDAHSNPGASQGPRSQISSVRTRGIPSKKLLFNNERRALPCSPSRRSATSLAFSNSRSEIGYVREGCPQYGLQINGGRSGGARRLGGGEEEGVSRIEALKGTTGARHP